MSELTVKYNDKSFVIKGQEIIQLELKLNLTIKGREYKKIGEYLYNFYTKEGCQGQPENTLEINQEEYMYLLQLNNKSYQDVWGENQLK